MRIFSVLFLFVSLSISQALMAQHLEYMDIFQFEFVSNPQISPDGSHIVYSRNYVDVMTDRVKSDLWSVQFDGTKNRPLIKGASSPVWSKDGSELYYLAKGETSTQIFKRWMDDAQSVQLTRLTQSVSNISPSPDGKWLAFTMFVPHKAESLVQLPKKPAGSKMGTSRQGHQQATISLQWARLSQRWIHPYFFVEYGWGTPRQMTEGMINHGGSLTWASDSKSLLFFCQPT